MMHSPKDLNATPGIHWQYKNDHFVLLIRSKFVIYMMKTTMTKFISTHELVRKFVLVKNMDALRIVDK
ncbi:hypothetical protein T12_11950 [Trichinella patagoniensis]|uniref:Uncharacterized protein n=1 Tax=Trichinella patagoniensis TaxID=990121 RepID=A0A0V1A7V8_9BILA|nr:hypothetical protein T12_11950 [Trichinella patagoniensis]